MAFLDRLKAAKQAQEEQAAAERSIAQRQKAEADQIAKQEEARMRAIGDYYLSPIIDVVHTAVTHGKGIKEEYSDSYRTIHRVRWDERKSGLEPLDGNCITLCVYDTEEIYVGDGMGIIEKGKGMLRDAFTKIDIVTNRRDNDWEEKVEEKVMNMVKDGSHYWSNDMIKFSYRRIEYGRFKPRK